MKVGIIGLGKMGHNIAQNMLNNGIQVVGYDIAHPKHDYCVVDSIENLVNVLPTPRIIWLMVPAGEVTNQTLDTLKPMLNVGDIIIDGGNSYYKDSVINHDRFQKVGIHFFDCGTSGGISGALNGGNFMIGGSREKFSVIEPIFRKISVDGGYLYTGEPGSGHYLKMIHNGIEYGMMQAIGEGFSILEKSSYDYNHEHVANLWNNGSVIRSWLMELARDAFADDPKLDCISGEMNSSGEGKWTVQEALELEVSIPVITTSLLARYESKDKEKFSGKVVSSLRNGFGGHTIKRKSKLGGD